LNKKIYADHAATTPLDPRVLEAMSPFLGERYYNPSALYPEARRVRAEIEDARFGLLDLIGGSRKGCIVFTGSGTESVNLALNSAVSVFHGRGRILISAVEHHAVLNYAGFLESEGFTVERLPVDRYGAVSPDTLKARMGPGTILVSVMSVNNETGAVNDTAALCQIAQDGGAKFHTDAVQALGVMRLGAEAAGADYISVSAHKIYGPKGIGALYAAPDAPVSAIIRGGRQENGMRAGTENVAGIIGFGRAAAILGGYPEKDASHLLRLRRAFLDGIAGIPDLIVNSPPGGAPHIISLSVAGVEAEGCLLRLAMAGIFASMGAACNSSSVEPSHVVDAIGVPGEYRRGTMRFSFGRGNTEEEASLAARGLTTAVAESRQQR
jgi:cysteine desulfurase